MIIMLVFPFLFSAAGCTLTIGQVYYSDKHGNKVGMEFNLKSLDNPKR
jgi:hypothetical protein